MVKLVQLICAIIWVSVKCISDCGDQYTEGYKIMAFGEMEDITECSLYETSSNSPLYCAQICNTIPMCSSYSIFQALCLLCISPSYYNSHPEMLSSSETISMIPDSTKVYVKMRQYTGMRYEVKTEVLDWEDARIQCGVEGGELLTMRTTSDYNTIGDLTESSSCTAFWTSGWLGSSDTWYWLDGNTGGAWIWDSTEPTWIGEECVAFKRDSQKLGDGWCSDADCYICEYLQYEQLSEMEAEYSNAG